MLLPEGPGAAVSVDYFSPLPVTPGGNIYILLFDRSLQSLGRLVPRHCR